MWGVSRKRAGAHRAPAGSGGSSDEGEGDNEDGDGDRDLPVLAAGCFVGATRTKQVLHQARRAASLVELLAQWKDGGWMDWGRPLWSLRPQISRGRQRWLMGTHRLLTLVAFGNPVASSTANAYGLDGRTGDTLYVRVCVFCLNRRPVRAAHVHPVQAAGHTRYVSPAGVHPSVLPAHRRP